MKPQHTNAVEGLQIALDVRASVSIGIHTATWSLTDEPLDEPPSRFVKYRRTVRRTGLLSPRLSAPPAAGRALRSGRTGPTAQVGPAFGAASRALPRREVCRVCERVESPGMKFTIDGGGGASGGGCVSNLIGSPLCLRMWLHRCI